MLFRYFSRTKSLVSVLSISYFYIGRKGVDAGQKCSAENDEDVDYLMELLWFQAALQKKAINFQIIAHRWINSLKGKFEISDQYKISD